MENEKLFQLYNIAEIAYKNKFEKSVNNVDDLFPNDWYQNKNYKQKIDIITEAIKINTLIINTPKYQNLLKNKGKIYIKEKSSN